MRYKPEQKEETRTKIVEAAERSFKSCGYSGIGVDGLAKEAGVTSGAFYGHFKSKEDVFKEAIVSGMGELGSAIVALKQRYGDKWWKEFVVYYTTQKRTCDLSESCALQSLTSEVGRSNESVRTLFESELLKINNLVQDNQNEDKAWVNLAMLIGGVTLARAVKDENLSNEIAESIRNEISARHKS